MAVAMAIILDSRRVKENEKYPVKLRVNYKRVTVNYQTIFDLSKEEYQRLSAPRISADLQAVKSKLRQIERDADDCIQKIEAFNFREFEKTFIQAHPLFKERKRRDESPKLQEGDSAPVALEYDYTPFQKKFSVFLETSFQPGTIGWSYCEYVKRLLREGRIGTALSYKCSYVSLHKFRGNVALSAITAPYLTSYEQQVKGEGLSKSTIGMYLRALRAIVNEAIEGDLLQKTKGYPFGKKKYRIPTARKVKKALELTDVEALYYCELETLSAAQQRSRDYWLFSYFGNGMNPKDIACLKYKNVQEDYIAFERAKSERSRRESPEPIIVYVNDDMKAIIQRRGNKPASPDTYLFPILEDGIEPLSQYKRIYNFVRLINKHMKRIMEQMGIDKPATTYVARHTFSTVLKRAGASTGFIREALGHADERTTQGYLDSFERDTKKQFAGQLLSFKKSSSSIQ